MERFCIRLAGIPIGVSCQFLYTKKYCDKYISDENPLIYLTIEADDIRFEKELDFTRNDLRYDYPEWYYEATALLRKTSDVLASFNVFLLHGSAIEVDGKAYIFTARSGIGKSTHAAFWRQELGLTNHTVHVINDDKPLIKVAGTEIQVCGSPWNGKHRLDSDRIVSLKAIGKIERDEINLTTPLSKDEYWITMIQQSYLPRKPEIAKDVLRMIQAVIESIPGYRIQCNLDPEAAHIAWQMINKE